MCNVLSCDIYNAWSDWQPCDVNCGSGNQIRTRTCKAGQTCDTQFLEESRACDTGIACPPTHITNGVWTAWSTCTQQCGGGTQNRRKECAGCTGPIPVETQTCNEQACEGTFSTTVFGRWEPCDRDCGGGSQLRKSYCPVQTCTGTAQTQTRNCNTAACPAGNNPYSTTSWTAWSSCSAVCDGGTQYRETTCVGACTGLPSQEARTCNPAPCQGSYTGGFLAWSQCSTQCGGGTQTREKACVDPDGCVGARFVETRSCALAACGATNRLYDGEWEAWSECSQACGAGTQTRLRTCTHGEGCHGPIPVETRACTGTICANGQYSAGMWSAWSAWSACSFPCGGGTRIRKRQCPAGLRCSGPVVAETEMCNVLSCEIYNVWSGWQPCDVNCGTGTQIRTRTCKAGQTCDTQFLEESRVCDTGNVCQAIDWSAVAWGAWGSCNDQCQQSREKTCPPARTCTGTKPAPETRDCNPCPWSVLPFPDWSTATACDSVTCIQTRSKTCPVNSCSGAGSTETRPCQPCDSYDAWLPWGTCDVTCGDGNQARTRSCKAGRTCNPNQQTETRVCSTSVACTSIDWSTVAWGAWGSCNAQCQQSREKTCPPARTCTGTKPAPETRDCNPCPWSVLPFPDWSTATACDSVTCIQTRSKTCPVNSCSGAGSTETRPCQPCDSYDAWLPWETCDVTCGDGNQARTRSCKAGRACNPNQQTETRACSTGVTCPPTDWSTIPWGAWGSCDTQCQQSRSKTCAGTCTGTKPDPETRDCNPCAWPVIPFPDWTTIPCEQSTCEQARSKTCPVANCGPGDSPKESRVCTPCDSFNVWGQWSNCDVPCGEGTQKRVRTCKPGIKCDISKLEEGRTCDTGIVCPYDNWQVWSSCSKTCGRGQRTRSRTCKAGSTCNQEDLVQTETCDNAPCPGEGLGPWTSWSVCSAACLTRRTRACTSGTCTSHLQEEESCTSGFCPLAYGEWTGWSACDNKCERSRSRICLTTCINDQLRDTEVCTPCTPSVLWGPWGDCSITCGKGGIQIRSKECGGNLACIRNPETQTRRCDLDPCTGINFCPQGFFTCLTFGPYCIRDDQVCDGVEDCQDAADEQNCDDPGTGVATASFVLPVIIILIILVAIAIIVIAIWCLCKKARAKRAHKIRPAPSPVGGSPPSGDFAPIVAPLIVPTKTWKGHKVRNMQRALSGMGRSKSSTHRLDTPHIINLPGNEVVDAGQGRGKVTATESEA